MPVYSFHSRTHAEECWGRGGVYHRKSWWGWVVSDAFILTIENSSQKITHPSRVCKRNRNWWIKDRILPGTQEQRETTYEPAPTTPVSSRLISFIYKIRWCKNHGDGRHARFRSPRALGPYHLFPRPPALTVDALTHSARKANSVLVRIIHYSICSLCSV